MILSGHCDNKVLSFIQDLKLSFSANPSHCSLSFFLRTYYIIPQTFTVTSEHIRFYRAMLCIRGTSHGPVSVRLSVSVCLSQVGVLLKRLNGRSHKQHHTIAQGL